jgi:cytoskeletal protein CcmA (bactofilin family)
VNDNEDKHTLVEEGTEFEGTLRARCRVIVRGSVEGRLEAPAVDVAETGTVTGELQADQVRSKGVLAGTIDAQDVSIAGTVKSDTVIRAKTLQVNLSAEQGKLEVTFGDCIVEVGDMPSEHAADDTQTKSTDKGSPAAAPEAAMSAGDASTDDDGSGVKGKRNKKRGGDDATAEAEASSDAPPVEEAAAEASPPN